jgi:hypothetical protein
MAPSPGVSGHHLPAEIVGRLLRMELALPTDVTTVAQRRTVVLSRSSESAPGMIAAGRRMLIRVGPTGDDGTSSVFLASRCAETLGVYEEIRVGRCPTSSGDQLSLAN